MKRTLLLFAAALLLWNVVAVAQNGRWQEKKANDWYAKQPWLVGSDYIPANAINELEMWQADTFDPQRIGLELGWAQGLGMNTMRVFLHDLLWQQDAEGFRKRIDVFLRINGYAITAESTAIYDSMMKLFEQRTFDMEHLVPWMREIVEHAASHPD